MQITLRKAGQKPSPSQTLVVFVSSLDDKKKVSLPKMDKDLAKRIEEAVNDEAFSGKTKETLFFRQANSGGYHHLLAVGVGSAKGFSAESARQAAAHAHNSLRSHRIESAEIDLDSLMRFGKDKAVLLGAFTEGLRLSAYEFVEYKSKKDEKPPRPGKIGLLISGLNKSLETSFKEAEILAKRTNHARWLGDHSGNMLTPTLLADFVKDQAKGLPLKVTIWDKARIKKEKFGGLLGVSLGSSEEPRFIIMEYNGAPKGKKPVYFVGKGLTFDSGGISIKPSQSMDEMKHDMCGGAAVVGLMLALAELKAKVNVVGLVPATENMPGGSAIKPGDILVHRNGKTTEVLNTDAEGRLVLADALAYANESKPAAIFDCATLTGAIVVALGNIHTGFFVRDDKLAKRITDASEHTGEWLWRMPLVDFHADDMKGTHADLNNISSNKGAGSSTAAAFLEQFVDKDIPFAHFDVAGTAWNISNRVPYAPKKGASGVMVRTFVELAKSYF